jgi:chromosome partition protein MukB
MEREVPRIERIYPMLQKLFQKSELFSFVEVSAEMDALKADIAARDERHRQLEESHKLIRNEHASWATELASMQSKIHTLERDRDRVQTICTRLEEEEPPEVLQGLVDFGRAEELAKRVEELDAEKERAQSSLSLGERKNGELRNRYQVQGETLAKLGQELLRARSEHEKALHQWKEIYPHDEPRYVSGSHPNEREQHKAAWDARAQALAARLAEVSARYEIRLPEGGQADHAVDQILQLLLPPGVELSQLEDLYSRLQHELQQIEHKIQSHVEEVRANVETEIRRLKMHLVRVNRILATLRFGQIKEIRLELEELPAYQALKKLESVLRMITRTESISLREFVQKLREFILKESNTTLSEEQIADYRSYIRIRRVIVDREDRVRDSGLSSGETLGVNLALCLAVLFFIGREQGGGTEGGMLLLALDEAERLDAKALETIRDLLDEVRCQLTVAMPRPVDIPDSVCHLLTPLSQGVTHIHLYHRGVGEHGVDAP